MVEPGTRIADRYTVTGSIGAGGMGVVVSARDEKLGRVVAIKVLPQSSIGDESARRRIIREARAAAALDHRSIVHVYDVGELDDHSTFFVMEAVKGKSLAALLAKGGASKRRLLLALVDVGRALQYAHEQGFVHRDIKPDNIMVRTDGSAVVLDFGLAKTYAEELAATAEAVSVTAKGGFVGTPAYVSPEQARGEAVDPATDQFALAVTIFEAMTGVIPWEGKTVLEVVSEILKGTPRELCTLAPEMPKSLEAALLRALEKDKEKRFSSMGAFVAELEASAVEVHADESKSVLPISSEPNAPASDPKTRGPISAASTRSPETLARAKSPLAVSEENPPTASDPKATSVSSLDPRSVTKISQPLTMPQPKWRAALPYALGAIAIGAGIFYVAAGRNGTKDDSTTAPSASVSNSATPIAPSSIHVVACPVFEVKGDEPAPNTWLGAAAATLACERVQWMLGGRSSASLVPAELAHLPREPKGTSANDPFEVQGGREKQLADAKEHADVTIHGVIERVDDVRIILRVVDNGGHEIGTAEGKHATVLGAVRIATDALHKKGIFSSQDETFLHRVLPGASVDAALRLHDLNILALAEDEKDVKADCAELVDRSDLGAMAALAKAQCAKPLGRALGARPMDDSSLIAMSITAAAQRFYGSMSPEEHAAQIARIDKLEGAAPNEEDPDVKALLFASVAEAVYYDSADGNRASRLARLSIQASPKENDLRGTAWHRQSFTSKEMGPAVLVGHVTWHPWEPFAQANLLRGTGELATYDAALRRAFILARHGYWPKEYGDWIARGGHFDEARGIAAETGNPYLTALIMFGEGSPGKALEYAKRTLAEMQPGVARGEATQLAAFAAYLAVDIGKPTDFINDFLARFLDPKKPAVTIGVTTLHSLVAICMNLKKADGEACVARLRATYQAGHFGAAFISSEDLISGAEHYVAGRWDKAAASFRPATGPNLFKTEGVREPMAEAFERAGQDELAEKLDALWRDDEVAPEANPAHVRSALRLEHRGDVAHARRIAQAYVSRWDVADEQPRGLDEMKKLLARTAGAAAASGDAGAK
jgi:serine/threonine protein kinase